MTDLTGDGARILLIATATHNGPTLSSIRSAARTFQNLRKAFLERCGVRPDRLRAILDPPTAQTMALALTEEAQRADTVLLIYFIGHGLLGPGGELYLAASSTDRLIPGMAEHQALSFSTLRQALTACRASSIVVVLDCCFSGRVSLGGGGSVPAFTLAPAHGMYLIGSAEQLALAPPDAVHTAFTGVLLELLTKGDPRGQHVLTLDAIYDAVFRAMRDSQRPLPRRQAGDRSGSLVIAPNPAVPQPAQPLKEAEPALGRCPWPGLDAFGVDDAMVFFGRELMTGRILAAVAAAHTGDNPGPLMLVGPSGSGKTSLLNAGLMARLRDCGLPGLPGSAGWLCVRLTPGTSPLLRLASQLTTATPDATDLLREDPGRAGELLDDLLTDRPGQRLIMLVDQLEELFTLCPDRAERAAFLQAVCSIAGPVGDNPPRGLVVLVLRADFYGQATAHPGLLAALRDRQLLVEPMTPDELRAAVEQPAAAEELDLDDGLADLLLHELGATTDGQPATGALPLLSHVLWATWRQRTGKRLTVAGYRAVGGISQAIATTADQVYTRLDAAGRDAVRRMLLRLVRVGEDAADTAQPVERSALLHGLPDTRAAQHAVDRLTAARLLTLDHDTARISHEALLRAWPLLREWIESDRAGQLKRQKLEDAAKAWNREGRHPDTLYRGPHLAEAQEWGPHAELTSLGSEFLDASIQHEDERQRDARRRTRRLRRLLVLMAVLLVFAVATTVAAVISLRFAQKRADIAIAIQASNVANDLRINNTAVAAQIALAAHRLAPGIDSRSAISSELAPPFVTPVIGHTDDVRSAAFSPDGRIVASGSDDRSVRLWDVASPHHPISLGMVTDHRGAVTSVAFSPDGRIVASGSDDRSVRLWDVASPHHPTPVGTIMGHDSVVLSVAFSPDGHMLASAGQDSTVRLWDVANPNQPAPFGAVTGRTGAVRSIAFHPGGRVVASGSDDGSVRLWDVTNPHQPAPLGVVTDHRGTVTSVAFSPDGHTLASAGQDSTVRLWDVTNPHQPAPLGVVTDHRGTVTSVAFSPDGHTLASADDNRTRLWNVINPHQPGELGGLPAHTGAVKFVTFSPDGHTLASGGNDHIVRLSDLSGPVLRQHTAAVYSVTFSPDGHTVATGSYDATIRLWDVTNANQPAYLATLVGHTGAVKPVAFSPDGRTLASAGDDRTVRLWNVTNPHQPTPLAILTGHTNLVATLAFSPNGHTLASAGDDKSVRLWDISSVHQPTLLITITDHEDVVLSVAFSPDGHTLASAGQDRTVRLWDITSLRQPAPLSTLKSNLATVSSLAFHPDSHTLATGSLDRTARLWDVTNPREPELLSSPIDVGSGVSSVAFSPDGRALVTGQHDGALRVWNVTNLSKPELSTFLRGHTSGVHSVAFNRDGRTIASGSDDRTALLWDIDTERVAERICEMTAHASPDAQHEWERRFPNDAYRTPCRG